MKLSDQRLDEILDQLRQAKEPGTVSADEWLSLATELRQLRLRTSSQSRSAAGSGTAAASN